MQAHATATQRDRQPRRRLRDVLLAWISPILTCNACGASHRQYACRRTGEVRTIPAGEPWTRWTAAEVEYECPECGASVWVVDMPTQYPIF